MTDLPTLTMILQLSVHYENNNPFLVVTRLERTVELSMWGNIAVEEVIELAPFPSTLLHHIFPASA